MKKTFQVILAGMTCLAAGLLLNGCLNEADVRQAVGQVGLSVLNSVNLVFAMQLYVAKTGTAPATVDELRGFLESEDIAIEIAPDWQLKSSIKGGVCEFTFSRVKEEKVSSRFSMENLNYDETRQQYLDAQKTLVPLGQILVGVPSSKP
jgi:hypothetical protein